MTARARQRETRRATYQDVLDAPPRMVAEMIAGTLHTHPRPAMRHAWASSGLGMKIGSPFNYGDDGPGGWRIVFEPEPHLGEDIVVPDLAGWRRETMPEYPDAAYCAIAPDWACEVLSPSTRRLDLGGKRALYARDGASAISGSSIPMRGRSRPSRCARGAGCCWPLSSMTRRSRFRPSTPSPFRSAPSGPRRPLAPERRMTERETRGPATSFPKRPALTLGNGAMVEV